MNSDKMIGNTHHGKSAGRSTCSPGSRKSIKRTTKRRERQSWKKNLSTM